jgi:hypothetical protein
LEVSPSTCYSAGGPPRPHKPVLKPKPPLNQPPEQCKKAREAENHHADKMNMTKTKKEKFGKNE